MRIAYICNIGSSRKGYSTKALAAFEQWAEAPRGMEGHWPGVSQSLPFWWKLGYRDDRRNAIHKFLMRPCCPMEPLSAYGLIQGVVGWLSSAASLRLQKRRVRTHPMEALQQAVLAAVQREGAPFQTFAEYHGWYVGHADSPSHVKMWPIGLDPDDRIISSRMGHAGSIVMSAPVSR